MAIHWNKVTWYSKLIAVLVFVVTFWGAFGMGVLYEKVVEAKRAANTPPPTATHTSGDAVLSIGQSKMIGKFIIILNSVPHDSRCPIDVTCIVAGAVKVNVTFRNGNQTITKDISTDSIPEEFAGYRVSVSKVEPSAVSTKKIPDSEYKVKFHIEKIVEIF